MGKTARRCGGGGTTYRAVGERRPVLRLRAIRGGGRSPIPPTAATPRELILRALGDPPSVDGEVQRGASRPSTNPKAVARRNPHRAVSFSRKRRPTIPRVGHGHIRARWPGRWRQQSGAAEPSGLWEGLGRAIGACGKDWVVLSGPVGRTGSCYRGLWEGLGRAMGNSSTRHGSTA
eukprot:scaffold20134_cov113-Isochrysis_galbana.AAC.1